MNRGNIGEDANDDHEEAVDENHSLVCLQRADHDSLICEAGLSSEVVLFVV